MPKEINDSSYLVNPVCQGCGERKATPFFQGKHLMQGFPGIFQLWRCQVCGTVFLDPVPTNMSLYYPVEYLPYTTGKLENSIAQKIYDLGLKKQINLIQNLSGLKKGMILDVGCARGDLLSKLQQKGWKVNGQEINDRIATEGRILHGIEIFTGDFQDVRLPSETYDLITFWMF